jgi:hypothetical protein
VVDEWQLARDSPAAAGVNGVEDLGRFVNDVTYLRPSMFDERAAMPVLLELLPTLTDPTLVRAVAAHLRRGRDPPPSARSSMRFVDGRH